MQQKNYKRFSKDEDFSNIDHIVIGSGIGGLTTATWLAKAGHKVLVLERHYVPGGFTHSFKRKQGFWWDVGVHYVGNLAQGQALRGMFNLLTDTKLKWEPMGDVYDVIYIGDDRYELKAGKEKFKKQLIHYFPEEERAINRYLKLLDDSNKWARTFFFEKTFKPFLSKTLGWYFRKRFRKYAEKTTYEILSGITDNTRLIAVLCGQCGNYGLSPKKSSFAAHALVINHFMEGGYYPAGGADQISLKTIDTLVKHGGKVRVKANVSEVVVKNNKVKGVMIGETFIPCKSVISNTGANNTFNQLLSKKVKAYCQASFEDVKPAVGHICLYVGLDQSSEDLKLPKHNLWCYDRDDIDGIFEDIYLKGVADKFIYISFPSAKDPHWNTSNPGTATLQAITLGSYKWFSEYEDEPWMNRGEVYESLKKDFEKETLEKLYQIFPQIKGHVVVTEVSTPLSTKHFMNYQNGEIYGLAHSPGRFKLNCLRPETRIRGLRLVGQDITLVGVAGAMLSGVLVATTILKFKVWKLFKEMNELKGG